MERARRGVGAYLGGVPTVALCSVLASCDSRGYPRRMRCCDALLLLKSRSLESV